MSVWGSPVTEQMLPQWPTDLMTSSTTMGICPLHYQVLRNGNKYALLQTLTRTVGPLTKVLWLQMKIKKWKTAGLLTKVLWHQLRSKRPNSAIWWNKPVILLTNNLQFVTGFLVDIFEAICDQQEHGKQEAKFFFFWCSAHCSMMRFFSHKLPDSSPRVVRLVLAVCNRLTWFQDKKCHSADSLVFLLELSHFLSHTHIIHACTHAPPSLTPNNSHTHTTPSQCNSQSVLFSCSLPPAWSDLISPAGVSFGPARAFYGPVAWQQDGFKMAAAASRFNPLPLTFTKILHHSPHLSIFGMLSPVYSHARPSPGTSWSSLTAVNYVLLGCKHWWRHNQFLPSFSLQGNYQTS